MTKPSVLLVEDDADLRKVVCEALEWMGYSVTTAVDARDALAKLEERPYDIVCSDVAMPNGMSGITLTTRIRELRPETRVILVSGYPRSELGRLPEGVTFLGKPYRLAQLLEALQPADVAPAESTHRPS